MSIRWACAVLGILVIALPGCGTLLGGGIGYAVDVSTPGPFEERRPGVQVPLGTRVRVHRVTGNTVEGDFLGTERPRMPTSDAQWIIERDGVRMRVEGRDVRRVEVEKLGNGVPYGAVIGFAADVAVFVWFTRIEPKGEPQAN